MGPIQTSSRRLRWHQTCAEDKELAQKGQEPEPTQVSGLEVAAVYLLLTGLLIGTASVIVGMLLNAAS